MRTLKLIPILTLVFLMGCERHYCEGTLLTVQISPNQKPFTVTVLSETETGYYVEVCDTKTTTCIDRADIVQFGQSRQIQQSKTSFPTPVNTNVDLSVKAQIILLGLIPFILFTLACYYPALWVIALPYAIIMGSAASLATFISVFIIFVILSLVCWLSCYWLTGFNAFLGSVAYLVFLIMFIVK